MFGGAGNDTLNGGADWDLTSYYNASGSLAIRLETSFNAATGEVTGSVNGHQYGLDKLVSIEAVIGSAFNDSIFGSRSDNTVKVHHETASGGYDVVDVTKGLDGGAGDDRLYGLAGDDILVGGIGADLLNGGLGLDGASYFNSKEGVFVSLVKKAGYTGDAKGDVLVSIEDLHGSKHADTLVGDNGNNWLSGEGGNDRLFDGGGADRVEGAAGDDYISASGWASDDAAAANWFGDFYELFDGGQGFDIADLTRLGSDGAGVDILVTDKTAHDPRPWIGATGGSVTSLDGSTRAIFIKNFEKFIGTNYADLFHGSKNDDSFVGGGGDDTFFGAKGADVYFGGSGSDTYVFDPKAIGDDGSSTNIDTVLDFQMSDKMDFSALVAASMITGDALTDFTTHKVLSGMMLSMTSANGPVDVCLFDKYAALTVQQLVDAEVFVF